MEILSRGLYATWHCKFCEATINSGIHEGTVHMATKYSPESETVETICPVCNTANFIDKSEFKKRA